MSPLAAILLVLAIIGFSHAMPQSAELDCGEDGNGVTRSPGQAWKEECNNCRCGGTGVKICTKKFCSVPEDIEVEEDTDSEVVDTKNTVHGIKFADDEDDIGHEEAEMAEEAVSFGGPALFTVDSSDSSNVPQCKQDGVKGCEKITADLAKLTGLKAGEKITVTPNGIPLTLKVAPSPGTGSSIYLFTTKEGLDANMVVSKDGKISATITTDGKIYVIESAEGGEHILYYRDQDYFNNKKD